MFDADAFEGEFIAELLGDRLRAAASSGQRDEVAKLLESRADPHRTQREGNGFRNALHEELR